MSVEALFEALEGTRAGQLVAGNPWVRALAVLMLAAILAKLVDFVITRGIMAWTRRTKTELDDRLIAALHRPVFWTVVLMGIRYATASLAPEGIWAVSVRPILITIAIVLWASFTIRAVTLLLEAASAWEDRAAYVEPRTLALFQNSARVILFAAAIYLMLLAWGIDVKGWLATAGVLGIVLGLAAQDSLANLFAGISILADAPYEIGDFVVLDSGERGRVEKVGLRSTRLLTRDDIEVTVPNSVIAQAKIINESGGPWEKERIRVKVETAYGVNVPDIRSTLLEIARENDYLAEEPEPRVRLRGLGTSALEFELLGWIDEPVLRGRALDSLYEEVYDRFRSDGIEIPHPKQDVYLRPVKGQES